MCHWHRRRKIFLSTGAQLNENKICVGGDVVLFIVFFSYITTNDHNNYTLGFA